MIVSVKSKKDKAVCPFCKNENIKGSGKNDDDVCEHYQGAMVKEIQYEFYFMGTVNKANAA